MPEAKTAVEIMAEAYEDAITKAPYPLPATKLIVIGMRAAIRALAEAVKQGDSPLRIQARGAEAYKLAGESYVNIWALGPAFAEMLLAAAAEGETK